VRRPLFIALAVCFCAAVSCSNQKGGLHGYICREHGYHRATVKEEFASCFRIKTDEIDSFYIFQQDSPCEEKDIDSTASRLKGIVADQIVDMIMSRIEAAYGKDLTSHWRLESIDIPVPFRRFVLIDASGCKVRVIALLKKDDLSPRSLIRFLPLEYKMNIIEPTEKEKQEFKRMK
jgi:hypothetical protein